MQQKNLLRRARQNVFIKVDFFALKKFTNQIFSHKHPQNAVQSKQFPAYKNPLIVNQINDVRRTGNLVQK
jgi:hypothetical protein